MWLELPIWAIALLNALGIPAVQMGVSWLFTRMPAEWFDPERFPFAGWLGESARTYDRWFGVKRWKGMLPDAAPWFGGFAKKRLRATDQEFLEVFRRETCRSEAAHWVQLILVTGFVAWTPIPWAWIIVAWAVISNGPCLVLQRQNRRRLEGVLARGAKAPR
ncbi:hypothetical protein [Haloferula sp.]|uniref:glycosyl-4,4'-diaponeurosporenoate acyltransferase CrtO family protein n=1 Tax=Haloferula sp. TaxID=2497595 RepID=UPI00329AD980